MCLNVELKGPSDPAKQLKIVDFSEPGSFTISSSSKGLKIQAQLDYREYAKGKEVDEKGF